MTKSNNLRYYVFSLLAKRPYHSEELRRKLLQKGIGTPEEQETIVQLCKDRGYLNDEEYLSHYVQSQLDKKPQSLILIKQKLWKKGIRNYKLPANGYNNLELAQKAAQKKLPTLSSRLTKGEKQQKLYRFLVGRGFSSSIALEVLKKILYNA